MILGFHIVLLSALAQPIPRAPTVTPPLGAGARLLQVVREDRGAVPQVKPGAPATSRPAIDDATFLSWLRPLKPLPKVHYSFPIHHDVLERPHDPLFYEYVRLTHAASLDGHWANQKDVEAAVRLCAAVNAAKPAIPATLAVNYAPWHRHWRKGQPPTVTGSPEERELNFMHERLSRMKQWVAQANSALGVNIAISAVLLDTEEFHTRRGDKLWNAAIEKKLNKTHRLVTELFPRARIEWYGRGVREAAVDTGWAANDWFTYNEDFRSFSCSLYRLPEIHGMRETFRRTVALAESKGVSEVTPWVALGSGYRRTLGGHEFLFDWDYNLVYSWQLGAEINFHWYAARPEAFAPWDRAKVVVFFPRPFVSRTWTKHFVAYVRGANGVRELPP